MIEINLNPGSAKKSRSRGAGVNFAGVAAGAVARVKDPYLLAAAASAIAAVLIVGLMYWHQNARATNLDAQLQAAQQDSIRFTAIIVQKRKAEAQRDSVVQQVDLIKSFDNKRYVWPHLMDEISRALPPYTWLMSVTQTNSSTAAQQDQPPPNVSKKKGAAPKGPPPVDTASIPVVKLHIVGQTVDIQALTRFMKLLEASPFIENVTLVRSSIVVADGKDVTEFQLDAAYQAPDPSMIKTVPVSLSVR
ncbi:MAG TPA: PilN domain-containing protein [Gemmatimonadaceae bacterium]|jgi:Tfp pilus assembly protein PilN